MDAGAYELALAKLAERAVTAEAKTIMLRAEVTQLKVKLADVALTRDHWERSYLLLWTRMWLELKASEAEISRELGAGLLHDSPEKIASAIREARRGWWGSPDKAVPSLEALQR